MQALLQVCRSLKRKDVEWRKKGNPTMVWWIDSVAEFMQPVRYEEKLIAQCKASAESGDFVALYPSMDQKYVSTNMLGAVEEAWDWEEQIAKEDMDMEEHEELRVGHGGDVSSVLVRDPPPLPARNTDLFPSKRPVFGCVKDGFDVIMKISNTPTDCRDSPQDPGGGFK